MTTLLWSLVTLHGHARGHPTPSHPCLACTTKQFSFKPTKRDRIFGKRALPAALTTGQPTAVPSQVSLDTEQLKWSI